MNLILYICTLVILLTFPGPILGQDQVYLSKDDALNLVLGEDSVKEYEPKKLTDSVKNTPELKQYTLKDKDSAHFFVAKKGGNVSGYALIDEEVGKHLPITYIVGISPEGKVTRIEVMVFREIIGWEIKDRRFLAQYESKTISDDLRIGRSLKNISGATLSAQAISRGTERALALWRYFYSSDFKENNSSEEEKEKDA